MEIKLFPIDFAEKEISKSQNNLSKSVLVIKIFLCQVNRVTFSVMV